MRKIYNAKTTIWVYDAFGKLAAEYSTETQTTPVGTYYRTTDHLGSTRLVTDDLGRVRQRHDFFPFGEQIPSAATFGNRNDVSDGGFATYNASLSVRQQFTGQQRDGETGLDYFWARNMAAPLGQFLSVDPENAGAGIDNPQSWNGYGYVNNNPMALIDPDGRSFWSAVGKMWDHFKSSFSGHRGNTGELSGNGINSHEWPNDPNYVPCTDQGRAQDPACADQNYEVTTTIQYTQLTAEQCAAARTVLEREAEYGTWLTAMQSGNTFPWADGTMMSFNSDFTPNSETPVGEMDLDWYTDMQLAGWPWQPWTYTYGKTGWSWWRDLNDEPIANYWPGEDQGEVNAAAYSIFDQSSTSRGSGYAGIFTPEWMAQACPAN